MLTLIALSSLAFGGWMSWTLGTSVYKDEPKTFVDWLSAVLIGGGAFCTVITAIGALFS